MIADYPSAETGFMRGKAAPLIRFGISRKGDAVTSETHEILLMSGGWDVIKFVDEKSASASLLIDKIRYTYNSSNSKAYVDIHYKASNSNAVGVTLAVTAPTFAIFGQIKAASLQSVADAPSGETVLTTYEFKANTGVIDQYWKNNPLVANSNVVSDHNMRVFVYGRFAIVQGWVMLSASPSNSDIIISGIPDAQTEQTVMYWDQNNNTAGALYVGRINGVWCLCTGGYSQTGHTGHYLNLTASYIVTDAYTARI